MGVIYIDEGCPERLIRASGCSRRWERSRERSSSRFLRFSCGAWNVRRGKKLVTTGGEDRPVGGAAVGARLREIRGIRGFTLRAVERETGISNAYLSQLETGKIAKPSPNYLYKLADFYGVPYDLLLEEAGYVSRGPTEGPEKRRGLSGAALATVEDLTPQEEEELMNYLAYLRSKGGRRRS